MCFSFYSQTVEEVVGEDGDALFDSSQSTPATSRSTFRASGVAIRKRKAGDCTAKSEIADKIDCALKILAEPKEPDDENK